MFELIEKPKTRAERAINSSRGVLNRHVHFFKCDCGSDKCKISDLVEGIPYAPTKYPDSIAPEYFDFFQTSAAVECLTCSDKKEWHNVSSVHKNV